MQSSAIAAPSCVEPAPASQTRMEEELAAPSTSTDKTDSMDVDGESKKLLGLGQKHLVMGNIPAAVNAFQEAASLLGKKYGETADECAEAFFYYGKSLLELARMENGVLGNALEGVQVEEEGEKAEEDSALPAADETEESEEEDKENDKADDDKENELTVEDKESEEDEIGNLELAWDMLELAKVIYKRQETKEAQLHAAQAHLKLGEVSIESENYTQAIEEFQACLALQQKYLEAHDRLLAESHYQLALAYHYNSDFDEAVLQFGKSMEVIDKRLAILTERIKKADAGSPEDEKEIEELKGLLPEIKEKIEDSKESQKSAKVAELGLKATLVGTTSGFAQSEDSGSVSTIPVRKGADGASQCVTDISHLVRKKCQQFIFQTPVLQLHGQQCRIQTPRRSFLQHRGLQLEVEELVQDGRVVSPGAQQNKHQGLPVWCRHGKMEAYPTPTKLDPGCDSQFPSPAPVPIPLLCQTQLHTTEMSCGFLAVPCAPSTGRGSPPRRQELLGAVGPRHSFSMCTRSSGRDLNAKEQRGQRKVPMSNTLESRSGGVTRGGHPGTPGQAGSGHRPAGGGGCSV
uniref:nuclear autoantigenic sperm protein isoform X3 n=1 Tax=Agelaius phoeniceus TaxID=39638 RepID=UPI0023ED4F01|nr:nuclear autoantigenic sperm protein isoform X3 [Agelaius phoeniceus]